jgi:hypothetical protein
LYRPLGFLFPSLSDLFSSPCSCFHFLRNLSSRSLQLSTLSLLSCAGQRRETRREKGKEALQSGEYKKEEERERYDSEHKGRVTSGQKGTREGYGTMRREEEEDRTETGRTKKKGRNEENRKRTTSSSCLPKQRLVLPSSRSTPCTLLRPLLRCDSADHSTRPRRSSRGLFFFIVGGVRVFDDDFRNRAVRRRGGGGEVLG